MLAFLLSSSLMSYNFFPPPDFFHNIPSEPYKYAVMNQSICMHDYPFC